MLNDYQRHRALSIFTYNMKLYLFLLMFVPCVVVIQACPDGTYGENCVRICNCEQGAPCDTVYGECADCAVGYTGLDCQQTCPDGKYGKNCVGECNCDQGATCNTVSGECADCAVGYTGLDCQQISVAVIAGSVGGSFGLVLIGVVLFVYYLKCKRSPRPQGVKLHYIPDTNKPETAKKHIMISYNHAHKELAGEVKSHLQKNGYHTWIDDDDMPDNLLDGMTEAVQNAEVVVIIMSPEYEKSKNCKREAEYALQLNKNIVPIKAEASYQPKDWLAFLLGQKIYIDFGSGKVEEKLDDVTKMITKMNLPKPSSSHVHVDGAQNDCPAQEMLDSDEK